MTEAQKLTVGHNPGGVLRHSAAFTAIFMIYLTLGHTIPHTRTCYASTREQGLRLLMLLIYLSPETNLCAF